jgi:hypothetical protein
MKTIILNAFWLFYLYNQEDGVKAKAIVAGRK